MKSLELGNANPPEISDLMPAKISEPLKFLVEDAIRLKRPSRLQALLSFNKMSAPVVTGTLQSSKKFPFFLAKIQTEDGDDLDIPLIGQHRLPIVPMHECPPNAKIGDRIKAFVNVVPDHYREIREKNNPFALVVDGPSEVLHLVELPLVVRDGSKIQVEKSIWEAELRKIQESLQTKFNQINNNLNQELSLLLSAKNLTEEENEQKRIALIDLDEKTTREKQKLQAVEADLAVGLELVAQINKQKEDVMAAYQEMRAFARDRAEILHTLDLISSAQFSKLIGESEDAPSRIDHLSWHEDLNQNYGSAVSSIHAFLLSQGMIYPRWLIGDFLTLLRMNDLIILSGLSGAGKTQLVRSFAQALGGVAHIIPVKPNWTGAEDLLGFFNPLQRTYVRTPFLEALLAAASDPNRLHFICLDEMNLARAEYYFADFLSAQEDRSSLAEISLYSESEASHIQAEVRMLLAALRGIKTDSNNSDKELLNIEDLIQRPEYMERLRSMFGENAGESFPVFHGRIRRSLSTVLDVPSKIAVSKNVRFIGAINVDQTTYGLSPKILDRAHVIRFDNPLKNSSEAVRKDAELHIQDVPRIAPIRMNPDEFLPQRNNYPEFSPEHPAARWMLDLYKDYLDMLGIDVAYRTIRQAQLFWDLHADVSEGSSESRAADAKNLIFLQKILPKFTMDGKVKVRFRKESEPKMRSDIIRLLEQDLLEEAKLTSIRPNMHEELHRVRVSSEFSDKIFNYWA